MSSFFANYDWIIFNFFSNKIFNMINLIRKKIKNYPIKFEIGVYFEVGKYKS